MADPQSPITHMISLSIQESCEVFREHMERAMLFPRKRRNRVFSIRRAIRTDLQDGLFVEFGVASGEGCRLFGEKLAASGKTITGFDSFEGLEEDWTGRQTGQETGAFTQGGKLPEVPENVTLVKGWIQDTLPAYLKETGTAPFSFIHMDMDTYSPTRFALDVVKSRLVKGSIILFDELYGYPGWKHHEYKALIEVLGPNDYHYISFSNDSVAIEMLRNPK